MVDTAVLGTVVARHVGSSPTWGTKTIKMKTLLLILPLLFCSLFTVKSQNFGQVNENNILKIEYFKFENNQHYFKVINKLNCEIKLKLDKPTNQFSDHNLSANSYMIVGVSGSANVMINIKARRTSGALCISSPDNGWVEMTSLVVLPIKFLSYNWCWTGNLNYDFSFTAEEDETISHYVIKISTDGKTFKTYNKIIPTKKTIGTVTYKTPIILK